jgi:hypothetical protein
LDRAQTLLLSQQFERWQFEKSRFIPITGA